MKQLEKIKEANESAYEYIDGIEHKLWATYAMDKLNYGHVTSNIAESNNSVLKESITPTSENNKRKKNKNYVMITMTAPKKH